MSASIDKDPAEEGENARAVLAGWLDDYASGRCDRGDMQESFLSVCRSNSDAPWDALALLDQYQRRGRIDSELAQSLKTDIAQLVFGVANQTEVPHTPSPPPVAAEPDTEIRADTGETRADSTGARWRKPVADRDAEPGRSEPSFDPTLFRRDPDPTTRPPPALRTTAPPSSPHTTQRAASSDVLRGRYELLSILGRGSSGTVYKALDRHRVHLSESARCVAVKVLNVDYKHRPDALVELEREFHQAQSLAHPNVVSVFDLDRDGGAYFIVMELLEGELLADILRRLDGRPMPREYALNVISSIGAALAHAHRREIVHGDLKPRNIMITYSGEVRVLDFGFARHRQLDLHSASALHDAPTPAPAYASVERVNGSESHQSDDVYSLACIAYELLSGHHPFGGRSAVLARAHGRRPQRVRGLSHKQSQALQRALVWTRGERKADLAEFLAGLGCTEPANQLMPPDELSVPAGRSFRWLKPAGLIALLIATVAGAAMLFWWLERLDAEQVARAAMVATPPAADREQQAEAAPGSEATPTAEATPAAPAARRVQELPPVAPAPKVARANGSGASPASASARPASEVPKVKAQDASKAGASDAAKASTSDAAKASTPQTSAAAGGVTIGFDKDTYVASENDGTVSLTVKRGGSTRRPATFRWMLKGNSAEAGSDFANIGRDTERIPAGVRELTITIPLVSDAVTENTEMFLVELMPAEDNVSLGEPANAAVIIVDDD